MDEFLLAAIDEAERGLAEGGIPIGSVLVHQGRILARGHNRRVQKGSAILHGEMDALENAGRQPARVYRGSTIHTTLSPCAMCSGSILLLYGIRRVIVGENRTFLGEEDLLRSRGVKVEALDDPRCQALDGGGHSRSPFPLGGGYRRVGGAGGGRTRTLRRKTSLIDRLVQRARSFSSLRSGPSEIHSGP